jgi:hypothetical protein
MMSAYVKHSIIGDRRSLGQRALYGTSILNPDLDSRNDRRITHPAALNDICMPWYEGLFSPS